METIAVGDRHEFLDAVTEHELPLSTDGANELWKIWEYRRRNGSDDEYLVVFPEWIAESKFDRKWPYMFAGVEYDNEDKGAILFNNVRLIDASVVENGVWDHVSMSELTESIDLREDGFVDEKGLVWISRSHGTVFEMEDHS